jgi:hypothetical protein
MDEEYSMIAEKTGRGTVKTLIMKSLIERG